MGIENMQNMQQMMKQAAMLQKKMSQVQDDLGKMELEGSAGGGLVKINMNGKHEVKKVQIDKSLLGNPDEVDILEDLIVAALNNANSDVKRKTDQSVKDLGLPPGMLDML
jgi:nucleoid-associated protein EbfC